MSVSVPASFSQQFEREVKLAYQRMSSKLTNRMMVRRKDGIEGKQTTFQVIGKGEASSKPRHARPTPLNLSHDPVPCVLEDRYALEYVDELDTFKVHHDERSALSTSIAGALGRASDKILTLILDADNGTVANLAAVDLAATNAMREYLDNNDVPDDGYRHAVVPTEGWTDLMALDEFSNADYIGQGQMPYIQYGEKRKHFNTFMWCEFSGLTTPTAGRKRIHAWHRSAVGFASQKNAGVKIDWENPEQMWSIVGSLAQGSCVIDPEGHYTQDLAV